MRLGVFGQILIFSIGLSIGLAPACLANGKEGTLRGDVTGQGAGTLGGVRVYLLKDASAATKGPVASSDYGGRFEFFNVRPGTYTLRLVLPGWREKFVDGVEIRAEDVTRITIEMLPTPPTTLDPAPEQQLQNRSDWWGTRFGDIDINELPTNRTIWSLLENQGTATVTEPLDSAQLATGVTELFGAHGASWTENQYLFNGFNATDPYITGLPLVDPDYASLGSMTSVLGAKPPNFAAAGTNLLIDPELPQPTFHGQAELYFSNGALASDNMTPSLAKEGFPGPQRMNSLYDGNAQVGGALPLGGWSWPIFAAFSTQQLSSSLGGFDAPIDAHVDHVLVELTPYRSGGRRLDLLYAGQQVYNSRQGAAIVVAPIASGILNNNFHQFQGRWSDALSDSSIFNAGFGVVHAIVSTGLQSGPIGTSTLDLPTLNLTGSAPLAQSGLRTRYEANSSYAFIYDGFLGSHAIAFGGDADYAAITNRWFALNNSQQITVMGAPSEIIQWDTPGIASQHVGDASVFVQDAWRPAKWLAMPLGLRLENSTGQADGANNGISWTTLEPHMGLTIPVPHFTKSFVLHLGWAQYGHVMQGQYLDYGDPAAIGGKIFDWNGTTTGQLLRVFGGPYSGIAAGITRPITDELSTGFDIRGGKYYQVRVRGWRRDDHHLIQSIDTGVPLSDYVPTPVIDPFVFKIPTDTAYRVLTLYNEIPSALGHDFDTLMNGAGYSSYAEGVDVEMTVFSGRNWMLQGSFTAMRSGAHTNVGNSVFSNDTGALNLFGDDPNDMVNNVGLTYFDRGKFGRLQAYYDFPWGFHAAVVTRYLDGLPYSPLLFVNGFNQGPFFALAVPRNDYVGFRAQFDATVDLRVSKTFPLWRGNLALDLDVFNLLNQNHSTQEQDLADSTLLVRIPVAIEPPRTGRIGLQWNF